MTTREASVEIITTVPQKFWLAKTFVLWDLEDCPVPPDLTAASVYCNILSAIGNMGYIGSFYLHAYSLKNEPEFVQGLEQAFGFKLEYTKIKIFRPESIRAKREHIVGDIYEWLLSNRNEPTNILLISGEILDCNQYVGALQLSIDYNGNVLLALPRDPSESVIGVSRSIWLWSSLSKGGDPLIEETKSLEVVNTLSTPPRTEPPLLCLNCYKKPIDTTEPVCQQTSILDKFSSAEVGVLWDLDVCPIPCGLTPGRIYPNIKTALRNMGYYGKVYVSAYSLEKLVNIEEFKSARINLVQPENGRAKRDNMITDVYMWGINHRSAPTNLMVITKDLSDDVVFGQALERTRGYENNILLALPQDPSGSVCVASSVWLWSSLSNGGSPLSSHSGLCLSCEKLMKKFLRPKPAKKKATTRESSSPHMCGNKRQK